MRMQAIKRTTVVYILPALGLGGVETGLGKAHAKLSQTFNLQIVTLDRAVKKVQPVPSRVMSWSSLLWIASQRKDAVIVTSLWRAHLFGILFRLCGFSWIPFFHNPGFGHILDRTVCRLSSKLAAFCFFDCNQTKAGFFGQRTHRRSVVVPFVFWNEAKRDHSCCKAEKDLDLVFVGRFARVKRLDLCIALTRLCISIAPRFRMGFVGQGGLAESVCAFAAEHPANVVNFGLLGSDSVREVFRRSKMALCLSDHEGMAMAIVEAIQEGCVPVVRRVGEIAHYADSDSSVICEEDLDLGMVAEQINSIRLNPELLRTMNRKAMQNLRAYPDYGEAFIAGVNAFQAERPGR